MNKVTMQAYGKTIIVDEDQVKFHEKKYATVLQASKIQKIGYERELTSVEWAELNRLMGIIQRLNRKIRQNVRVIL